MTMLGLVLDILLIVMLGVMIFFVMRLHNRLEVLRRGKTDLEGLLHNLVASTASAERSLIEMRGTAGDLSATLQKQISGANAAREELEFLLSSADKIADTLVSHVTAARGLSEAPAAAPKPHATPTLTVDPESAARPAPKPQPAAAPAIEAPVLKATSPVATEPSAREAAERDLLRAIEKLR